MQKFIDLLLREPLLLVILAGWVFGILGRVMSKVAKAQREQAQRQRQAGGAPTGQAAPTPRAPAAQRVPLERRAPERRAPAAPRQRGPTAEEVAAEMRRILGLEPEAAEERASAERAPVEPLSGRPERAEPMSSEKAPEPLRPSKLGQLAVQVDPHVGARIQQRRAPVSGAVGAQQLGMLGGRTPTMARSMRRGASALIDLSNLPRAIVLREILDRPLGLRDLE
jgi:hypothetical protein